MAKITLRSILSGFLSNAAQNANYDAIEAEFQDKVLYRDNPTGEPNQMENNLDMNSNRILNLPSPINLTEPARWGDLQDELADLVGIDTTILPSMTGNQGKVLAVNDTADGITYRDISTETKFVLPTLTELTALTTEGTTPVVNENDIVVVCGKDNPGDTTPMYYIFTSALAGQTADGYYFVDPDDIAGGGKWGLLNAFSGQSTDLVALGADNTGVTNSDTAMTTAIALVEATKISRGSVNSYSTGRIIDIPPGNYNLSSLVDLTVTSGVRIRGAGRGVTVLQIDQDTAHGIALSGEVVLEDLTVTDSATPRSSAYGGIYITDGNITVRRVAVDSMYRGIWINQASGRCILDDVQVSGNAAAQAGIYVAACVDLEIRRPLVTRPTTDSGPGIHIVSGCIGFNIYDPRITLTGVGSGYASNGITCVGKHGKIDGLRMTATNSNASAYGIRLTAGAENVTITNVYTSNIGQPVALDSSASTKSIVVRDPMYVTGAQTGITVGASCLNTYLDVDPANWGTTAVKAISRADKSGYVAADSTGTDKPLISEGRCRTVTLAAAMPAVKTLLSVAHGGTAAPDLVYFYLECDTNGHASGYEVGEIIPLSGTAGENGAVAITPYWDATNVYFSYDDLGAGNKFNIMKSDGTAESDIAGATQFSVKAKCMWFN